MQKKTMPEVVQQYVRFVVGEAARYTAHFALCRVNDGIITTMFGFARLSKLVVSTAALVTPSDFKKNNGVIEHD